MRNVVIVMSLVGTIGCTTKFESTGDGETDTAVDTAVTDTVVDTVEDSPVDTVVDTDEDTFDPYADNDGDGFSPVDGDCDDSNPGVNPDAWDAPGNDVDDDCDGETDNPAVDCDCPGDASLGHGLDMCDPRFFRDGAVISFATNAHEGRGLHRGYGSPGNDLYVRQGCSFTVLGTGVLAPFDGATCDDRQPGTDLYGTDTSGCTSSEPEPSPEGSDGTLICDQQQLAFDLTAPSNAHGFSFDFIFISSEFPEWVAADFKDTFYAILQRWEPEDRYNIVFDHAGAEINVASMFIEDPPETGLGGTGYDIMVTGTTGTDPCGSSTGWLRTEAPIRPGEQFSLTFSIHDEGDGIFDSVVILDNFLWMLEPPEVTTYEL